MPLRSDPHAVLDMFSISFTVGSRYQVNRKRIRQQVQQSFGAHGITSGAVDVSIVGSRQMKHLNESIMKHQGVTDVLSFPQQDPQSAQTFPTLEGQPTHYGDIVICFPVAVQEAVKKGKLVDDVIDFYVDHSIQHLLGFHHD